jgi:NADH-quinone oxidoreductase subunit F
MPGGSSTPPIRDQDLDVDWDHDSMEEVGSRPGTGGIIVMDDQACIPKMARRLAHFYAHESCGWCTPCREGVPWLEDVLEDIEHGRAREGDVQKMKSISNQIDGNCFCPLGPSAAIPVLKMFDYWQEEFEHHMEHGECSLEAKQHA